MRNKNKNYNKIKMKMKKKINLNVNIFQELYEIKQTCQHTTLFNVCVTLKGDSIFKFKST